MRRKTGIPALPGRALGGRVLGSTAAAAVAATVIASNGPSHASHAADHGEDVASGNPNVTLQLSGQVNRGVLYVDDGNESEFLHVDNDNSSTRIRFVGVGRYNESISAGTVIEVQHESNSTANILIDGSSPGSSDSFTERKLELYFDHAQFGRIWLGQGDTASNGTSEVDLSKTGVIAYSGIADLAGGIQFGGLAVDAAGNPINATNPRINTVFSNFDGLSRDDRIRYDTPTFSGFQLSASHADSRKSDVAARFSGDVGAGLRVAAGVAYAINGNVDSQVNGSVSVLHDSGFNVTGAVGQQDLDVGTRDPFFWYAKLGYIWSGGIGDTAFAIDYTQADDVAVLDDEFTAYGAFVVQHIDNLGAELYLGVRNHELDRIAQDFDDVVAVLGGARIKF